ncbi:hypothetical protein KQX54_002033 [Cotesia glomerata]|uniref:Uncharacterized protein n=1 Tax=Cotesia glomerata TaxID=32391 RepID=A0AAV7IWS4_COTGL|nr:hypothetical protein KQX54_002033 [Cotesia glomerata]
MDKALTEGTRKRVDSVLSQQELDLPVHVLVVDGLAPFVVDAASHLCRLLIVPGSSPLVQETFVAEDLIQDSK